MLSKGSCRPFTVFPRFHCPFPPFFQPHAQAAHQTVARLQFHPNTVAHPRKKSCLQDFEQALFGESLRFQIPTALVPCPSLQVPARNACWKPTVQPRPETSRASFDVPMEHVQPNFGNPRRGGGGPFLDPSSCTRSLRTNLHLVRPRNHRRRATGHSTLSISRTRNSSNRSWE